MASCHPNRRPTSPSCLKPYRSPCLSSDAMQPSSSMVLRRRSSNLPMNFFIVHSAKRQFADLSQVIKTAYDLGSVYGQDFMSESSYSAMVDALLSFVFCGTQSAVSRYMNKAAIEGGAVTRTILCPLISHLGDQSATVSGVDRYAA